MTNEVLISRINSLCKENEITQTKAFVESGVGKNFKSNMKFANPSKGKITMLAVYFGVSVDYLLGLTEERSQRPEVLRDGITDTEREVLHQFRLLTKDEQAQILNLMKTLTGKADHKEKQKD